jgi:hypothetical protein
LYDCFVANCCEYRGKDKSECNAVCPRKPDFHEWIAQLRGRRFDYIAQVAQRKVELPTYVPLIDHGYDRRRPLRCPVVALDTYKVIRKRVGNGRVYSAVAETPEELRASFGLNPSTSIILRGVAKDPPLERWWEHRLADQAPEQLARLNIAATVAPNFSHFLDVPRTDNLFNRVRQMICMEELTAAGHCVVPHISTAAPGDWQYWLAFLHANPTVRHVAKEFQTGYRAAKQGHEAIDRLARLQDDAGRSLHLIIIGGVQFVELLAKKFDRFTLVDSMPFAKAVHRQRFDRSAGRSPWQASFTLIDQSIDDLLDANLRGYREWIDERIAAARREAGGMLADGASVARIAEHQGLNSHTSEGAIDGRPQ